VKVRWTPEAEADRLAIFEYIAADNPAAAARMDDRFAAAARHLAEFPRLGGPGKVTGTRELMPHDTYRLVYELHADEVWILAVVHAARQWPPVDS